jgi:hypothetical protein
MEDPFSGLRLEDLEDAHLQWQKERRSAVAYRAGLVGDIRNFPIRVFPGRLHPFKRRKKQSCTDGVEHAPETHPGWLTDEGTHSIEAGDEDGGVPEFGWRKAAGEQALSLHVGPMILSFSNGDRFFRAVSKTLAITAVQCMPTHAMHLAYMEHAKDARDRLARVPRERGRGFEELRGVRVELPTRLKPPSGHVRRPFCAFRPYSRDERLELYRRIYGDGYQMPEDNCQPTGSQPSEGQHYRSPGQALRPKQSAR